MIAAWIPITKQNLDAIRPGLSSPHTREIYTLRVRMFTIIFLGSSNRLPPKRQRGHSCLIVRGSAQGSAFWWLEKFNI